MASRLDDLRAGPRRPGPPEREIEAHESFNYALFDDAASVLLGCVYIDPPEEATPPGADAVVSWWVVDELAGTPLETELDEAVTRWLAEAWPFAAPLRYP